MAIVSVVRNHHGDWYLDPVFACWRLPRLYSVSHDVLAFACNLAASSHPPDTCRQDVVVEEGIHLTLYRDIKS